MQLPRLPPPPTKRIPQRCQQWRQQQTLQKKMKEMRLTAQEIAWCWRVTRKQQEKNGRG
jgi:hypothetical protein